MFKRVFNRNVFKQILIIAIITALVAGAVDLFLFGNINTIFPKAAVYEHFNEIATQIVQEKSVDFLENSGTLDYFTVFTDSKTNTRTICLYGDYGETLTVVLSNDYNLISMERLHSSGFTVLKMAIGALLRYLFIGLSAGVISSIIVSVGKFIFNQVKAYFNKKFGGFLEKLFEDDEDDDDDNDTIAEKHQKKNTKKPEVVPAAVDDEDAYDDFDINQFDI